MRRLEDLPCTLLPVRHALSPANFRLAPRCSDAKSSVFRTCTSVSFRLWSFARTSIPGGTINGLGPGARVSASKSCKAAILGFLMKKLLSLCTLLALGSAVLAQDKSAKAPDPAPVAATRKAPDRAAAYYHSPLAHMYEEQVASYGRS